MTFQNRRERLGRSDSSKLKPLLNIEQKISREHVSYSIEAFYEKRGPLPKLSQVKHSTPAAVAASTAGMLWE